MKKKDFMNLCRMSQGKLKKYVEQKLIDAGYPRVNAGDGYVYAKGDAPVLLTAHLDTVHKKLPKHISIQDGILSSPNGIGGDDRCGVFIILSILRETSLRPSILFCEDEETGGEGSDKFCMSRFAKELEDLNFLIEIDRQGKNDAVFYNCGNLEFIEWIQKETGFKEEWGTFSDISNLSPECDVASVNLSCGYYKQHTVNEYVVWNEMVNSRYVVEDLIKKSEDCGKFDYKENKFGYYSNYWYGSDLGYGYNYNNKNDSVMEAVYILYRDKDGKEYDCEYLGSTQTEAFGDFFLDHPDICFNDILDWSAL